MGAVLAAGTARLTKIHAAVITKKHVEEAKK
jgi:hypothetical protein